MAAAWHHRNGGVNNSVNRRTRNRVTVSGVTLPKEKLRRIGE